MNDGASELLVRAKAGDGEARMELGRIAARAGKRAEAEHWIIEAAAAGQRAAVLQTGLWAIRGYRRPADIAGGRALVEAAVEAGEPAAKTALAMLHASGLLGPRDWDTARTLLLQAAEAHDPRALTQVALMLPTDRKWQPARQVLLDRAAGHSYPTALFFSGRALLDGGGQESQALARLTLAARAREPNALRLLRTRRATTAESASPVFELAPVAWTRIADGVRWPHERALPQLVLRYARPRVATFNRLLTAEECEYLVSRGAPYLKRSSNSMPGVRTNATAPFGLGETDALILSLDTLISHALGEDEAAGEGLALMHYAAGQTFVPRPEDIPAPANDALLPAKTLIVYLNDAYEGGESAFLRLGWRYKGRRGDALLWDLRGPDGIADPRAIPQGEPPRAGEKFVLSKLVRARPKAA